MRAALIVSFTCVINACGSSHQGGDAAIDGRRGDAQQVVTDGEVTDTLTTPDADRRLHLCSFSVGPCDFTSDDGCPELEPNIAASYTCDPIRAQCFYCDDNPMPPVVGYDCLESPDGPYWSRNLLGCADP